MTISDTRGNLNQMVPGHGGDSEFFNQQARISLLERRLESYLNSRSWRSTRWLREICALLPGPEKGHGCHQHADSISAIPTEDCSSPTVPAKDHSNSVFVADSYVQYLKRTIRLVRRSRSWQLTKPLRRLQMRLSAIVSRKTRSVGSAFSREDSARTNACSVETGCASGGRPLVSIVVPTWNRCSVLPRALSSVKGQTYESWECLIVDDGSTDDTAAVVRPYLNDARFKYVRIDHGGVSRARNAGIIHSSGDIISYLDSDNVWLPDYLEQIVRAYGLSPQVNAFYTAQLVQLESDHSRFAVRCHSWDAETLRKGNFIDLNVFSHRRLLVDRYGGFDENLSRLVDWDLILRYTA